MSGRWLPVTLALVLAGCSQSQSREVVATAGEGVYPARMPLSELSAAMDIPADHAPIQPDGGMWTRNASELTFGVPGQPAMLSLACAHDRLGAAGLVITRRTRAEDGAKALLALIGNGRIARLPLDAVTAGEAGEWRGTIPAADTRLDVLRGGNRIEGTLPGGGTILMPASGEPGRLLMECRASDRAAGSA